MRPARSSGWGLANLIALLNHRYNWERPTIITSNLTLDTFTARYLSADGGRLMDRLREVGDVCIATGASLRTRTPETSGQREMPGAPALDVKPAAA